MPNADKHLHKWWYINFHASVGIWVPMTCMQIKVKRRLPEHIFMWQIYVMVTMEQQIFATSLKSSAPVMTLDSSDTQKQSEAVVRSRLQKYMALTNTMKAKLLPWTFWGWTLTGTKSASVLFVFESPPPPPALTGLMYAMHRSITILVFNWNMYYFL